MNPLGKNQGFINFIEMQRFLSLFLLTRFCVSSIIQTVNSVNEVSSFNPDIGEEEPLKAYLKYYEFESL
jgi:hypothetical protein